MYQTSLCPTCHPLGQPINCSCCGKQLLRGRSSKQLKESLAPCISCSASQCLSLHLHVKYLQTSDSDAGVSLETKESLYHSGQEFILLTNAGWKLLNIYSSKALSLWLLTISQAEQTQTERCIAYSGDQQNKMSWQWLSFLTLWLFRRPYFSSLRSCSKINYLHTSLCLGLCFRWYPG